jgi:acid phosphatase type 7
MIKLKFILRKLILIALALILVLPVFCQPTRKGWWNFNDTLNPRVPVTGYGLPLELVGSHAIADGPVESDYAVSIGPGSYYRMDHQIAANGGGNYVNEYTLQIDFKVETLGQWYCFFQTSPDNSNDGDCFINPSGNIGVAATGYTPDVIYSGQWYRLVISVDNGTSYTYYLDGVPVLNATIQDVDGRFALDPILLMFADENVEDNTIIVSEIAIWDQPLAADDVASLGGFDHTTPPGITQFICYPFLQSMTSNSVIINWHDTLADFSRVSYGKTPDLGNVATGSSEIVTSPFRWHTVKLNFLEQATKYYYRLESGSGNSAVYSFTTLPDDYYQGHIRFLLLSDSQSDSAATGFIIRSARDKIHELYGPGDPDDYINLIMHCGDITGSGPTISGWTDEFFRPFAPLSANIPFMSVVGNHEGESMNYYTYVKYDDFSAFPADDPLFEKLWTYRMPRTLFVGVNTNVTDTYGSTILNWLDGVLNDAESDPSIDFVFCFMHHPPVSEIWGEGNTSFVNDLVLPVLQKYSKVQQLSYGHTHAYERGVIQTLAPVNKGDFRIACVGSGGGWRDRWGEYTNYDYPQIHIAIDHYFYIIFDIDLGDASYEANLYDLGNVDLPATNQLLDEWHHRLNQPKPDQPLALDPETMQDGRIILKAGPFSGLDQLMSSRFELTGTSGQYETPLLDKTTDWQDIYGTDSQFRPVDLNAGKDLTRQEVPTILLEVGKNYYFRVRYRDRNLKWSDWSEEKSFKYTGTQGVKPVDDNTEGSLRIYPNPFRESTVIHFGLERSQQVRIEIRDLDGKVVAVPADGFYIKNSYEIPVKLAGISSGIYFCTMITESDTYTVMLEAGI